MVVQILLLSSFFAFFWLSVAYVWNDLWKSRRVLRGFLFDEQDGQDSKRGAAEDIDVDIARSIDVELIIPLIFFPYSYSAI